MAERKYRSLATRNVLREGQTYLQRAARRRYPVAIGGFAWTVQFLIQAAALSVRVFFRRKIGERSFSPALILFSYFWVRCFLFNWKYSPPEGVTGGEALLSYIYYYFNHIISIVKNSITFSFGEGSPLIYWYSFIVLLLGILHWLPVLRRMLFYERHYSHGRGESVFFGWLEGTPVDLGFGEKTSISGAFIRTVLDPLFIVFLGLGIMAFLDDHNFGLCVILSAVALFIEEYGFSKEARSRLLDVHDAEYVAEQLELSLSKYDQGETQSSNLGFGMGAVLATPDDAEKMRKYMAENKGKTVNPVSAKLG